MKKTFFNGSINKKKVLEFFDKKGFYIVLVLCIGIITLTAYYVTKRNLSSYTNNTTFEQLSKVTNPNTNQPTSNVSEPKTVNTTPKTDTKKPDVGTKNLVPKQSVQPVNNKPTATNQIKNIEVPVQGNIIKEFAKNNLIYSNTLSQWTTHEGIDILSERGTPVKSAHDGVVSEIYSDSKYGITIVIDSGLGLATRYCNLSTDSMVKKGAKVKRGDVISGVGNTALFESIDEPHLHFEVIENGINVNPTKYFQ